MSRVARLLGAFVFLPAAVAGTYAVPPPAGAVGPTVGVADSVTVIRPTITPTGLASSVDLVAARGEYESVQLVVTGPATVTAVTAGLGSWGEAEVYAERAYTVVDDAPGDVVANDHVYPGGVRQPTDPEARGPGNSWNPAGGWFDALVPEQDLIYDEPRNALPMTVAPGEYGAIWVDIFVPTTAAAGVHSGSIAVASGGDTTTVPVSLEVLNWTMPATSTLPNVFMMQGTGNKVCVAHACTGTVAQKRQEQQLLSSLYARTAVENRISLGNGFGLDYSQGPDALYTDAEFEAKVEGPLFEGGPPYPATAGFHLTGARQTVVSSYAYFDHCRTACAASWSAAGTGETWAPRFYWYGCDEAKPDGSGQHPQWSECATYLGEAEAAWNRPVVISGSWQNWASNGGTASGLRPATGTGPAMQIDAIAPYFDQIVPNNDRDNLTGTRPQYDAFLAANPAHQAWLVTACNAGACGNVNWEYAPNNYTGSPGYAIDAPANQARAMSWYVDRWDMDGELHWAANQTLTTAWTAGGQYESGMNGDGNLFYPGNADDPKVGGTHDIPIESIRLKRIRDGREDWEYLHFLREHGHGAEVDAIVDGLYHRMYDATWAKDGHGAGSLLAARQQLVALVRAATVEATPEGRIAYSRKVDGLSEIFTVATDGTDDQRLTTNSVPDGFPAWSPDATRIAFSRGTQASGEDLWVMAANGSNPVRLVDSPAGTSASKPAWSKNGKWLFYVRTTAGVSQILRIPSGGGAAATIVTGYDPSIHPDGRVFYSHAIFGGQHVYAKTTGGLDEEITYGPVDEAVDVSGDGSMITYSKTNLDYSADYQVYVRDSTAGPGDGAAVVTVAGNAYQSAFSPDDSQLVYVSDAGGSQLWRAHVDGSEPTRITDTNGLKQDPDWARPSLCNGLPVTVNLARGQVPTSSDDVILGTTGADTIVAGNGNDVICAAGGDDVVEGGAGNDVVIGGSGSDAASFAAATTAVIASLATPDAQYTGTGTGTDTIRSVEKLYGSARGDKLTGNGQDNVLLGADGNDRLIGKGGTDQCDGGAGTDSTTQCENVTGVP